MIIRWQKIRVFIDQGSCRDHVGGWAEGTLAPPPPTFLVDKITILFFTLVKPGLSFAKKVHYIILCQICRPLRERSLIVICPFRSKTVCSMMRQFVVRFVSQTDD